MNITSLAFVMQKDHYKPVYLFEYKGKDTFYAWTSLYDTERGQCDNIRTTDLLDILEDRVSVRRKPMKFILYSVNQ